MSLDLEIASSQYAYTASPAITAVPFTVSAWVKAESSMGSSGVVGGLMDTATDTNYHHLNISSLTPRPSSDAAVSIQSAPWGSAVSTAVWVHLLATFGPTAGVDRNISVDGGTFVQSTTNRNAGSLDTFGIGARKSAAPALFFDGLIAQVAVWDVQLTQGEAAALASGIWPKSIRPSNLKHFWPLYGDGDDYTASKSDLTLVASPVFSEDSPPVQFWTPRAVTLPYAIAAGGATYNKDGSLSAGGLQAGADVFEAAETGALTPGATLSGVRVITDNRLGSLASGASLSGADVFTAAELGSLISGTLLAGTAVKTSGGVTYEKAGALITAALLAGADVFTAAELGSLTPGARTSGADVFEAAETGALIARALLAGADSFNPAETGSLAVSALLAGADVFTAAETGTLMAYGFLAGVGQKSGTIVKAGSLISGALLAGADAFTATETGALIVDTSLSGARIRDIAKTGLLVAAAQLRGADVFTAVETGALTVGVTPLGLRVVTFNRTGVLDPGVVLGGVSVLASSLTFLAVIGGGRIDIGSKGHVDRPQRGSVTDSEEGEL